MTKLGTAKDPDSVTKDYCKCNANYENETPTDKQKEVLAQLIARFEKQYKVNVTVRGHKEVAQTATSCPGKNIGTSSSGWLKTVIARANEILTAKPWYETVVPSVMKMINDNVAYLYGIDTGEKIKEYAKGTQIGVDYTLGDYYLTAYSVEKQIKNGFKKVDWKLFVEEPEVPPVVETECERQLKILTAEIERLKLIVEAQEEQIKGQEAENKELGDLNESLQWYKEYFEKLSNVLKTVGK
jgi:hypothetical protein